MLTPRACNKNGATSEVVPFIKGYYLCSTFKTNLCQLDVIYPKKLRGESEVT